MLAMLSLVLIYFIRISPICTRSRKKWCLISKCLDLPCCDGSLDNVMAALLSHNKVVALFWARPISDSKVRSQIASLDASNAAVYSASHDDVATVLCFLDAHDMRPEPRENP